MKFTLSKKALYIALSAVVIAGIFVLGLYIGYSHRPATPVANVTNTGVPAEMNVDADFAPFWKVWKLIDAKHPGADKTTAQARVYGAIQGMVNSLGDPYSVYFPPTDATNFETTIQGSFDGIGMEVGEKDGILTVIAPLKGSPSELAGIKAGDKIIKIGKTSTNNMTVDAAVTLIRGPKGTPVTLTIYREGEDAPRDITVIRDTIKIPTLEYKLRDDGVFVIGLYNFSASSAQLMEEALRNFAVSGSTKLVIDLRGNPGGYLDSAVDMASFFLPAGETVVSEDFGANGPKPKIYRSKGFKLLDLKAIKIAILVDKGSASASEILAGALNERGVAPLIGETTYGKGSVQEVIDITDTTMLKLTVAKWLTPNGVSISEKGIEPTIPVKVTETDIKNKVDPVMNRALQYFKDGK